MPVTRQLSLVSETPGTNKRLPKTAAFPREKRLIQEHSFCDWVSIYQRHAVEGHPLPRVNDGAFVRYNADGTHECTTLKKFKLEGSHATSVSVRCDGETVWFEGNVSRFGRPDNVFGFTFEVCIQKINAILASHGLPPFTSGESERSQSNDKTFFTGARITRLDLTANFQTGSIEDAQTFMRHLAMQQASRLKTGTYGEGETVDFGRGSRYVYSKCYVKHVELLRHMKKAKGVSTEFSKPHDTYVLQVAEWCANVGLVRFESTYKSTFLIDQNQQFLGGLDMRHLEQDFLKRQEVFTRFNCEVDELAALDKHALSCYRMWQAGDDLTQKFSRAQFYKNRARLLPYGVDIAIKSSVIGFQTRVRVVKLAQAVVPSFYQLPSTSNLRLAA